MRLFGHRYLGPGNPLPNGEPVDEDDRIALEHDEAYEKAEDPEQVFEADLHSIGDFASDFADRGSFHSLLGVAGLGAKHLVERYVVGRPLYGMHGRKRTRQHADSESDDGRPALRPRHEQEGPEPERSAAARTAAGGSGGGGAGGAGVGSNSTNVTDGVQQILRVPRDQGSITVLHDSKILTTWGLAMHGQKLKVGSNTELVSLFTSLSHLPVECTYFYMSYQQFNAFREGSRAVHCTVKVTPHGIRTPWKTGTSVVQPVNSDMMVYGATSVGLNHVFDIIPVAPTAFKPNNAMEVTAVSLLDGDQHKKMAEKYWGLYGADDKAFHAKIPCCMGVARHNNFYDCLLQVNDYHYPRLTKHMNVFPFKGHVGQPIVNYEYRFEHNNAYLKYPTHNPHHERVYAISNADDYRLSNRAPPRDGPNKPINYYDTILNHAPTEQRYTSSMESPATKTGMHLQPAQPVQPSLNIGILAVSKTHKDDPASTTQLQDVMAFWQVDSTLTVFEPFDSISTYTYRVPANERVYSLDPNFAVIGLNTNYEQGLTSFSGYPSRIMHDDQVPTTTPTPTRNQIPRPSRFTVPFEP